MSSSSAPAASSSSKKKISGSLEGYSGLFLKNRIVGQMNLETHMKGKTFLPISQIPSQAQSFADTKVPWVTIGVVADKGYRGLSDMAVRWMVVSDDLEEDTKVAVTLVQELSARTARTAHTPHSAHGVTHMHRYASIFIHMAYASIMCLYANLQHTFYMKIQKSRACARLNFELQSVAQNRHESNPAGLGGPATP